LVRGAATTILILHISGGGLAILSGAAALLFRKCSRRHRLAGNVFFVSMLTLSAIGACVAPFFAGSCGPGGDDFLVGSHSICECSQ